MSANKKKHIKTINNLLFHASFAASRRGSSQGPPEQVLLLSGCLLPGEMMRCDVTMVAQDAGARRKSRTQEVATAVWKASENIASCKESSVQSNAKKLFSL